MAASAKDEENVDKLGRSELHYAVGDANSQKVAALIALGADINRQDRNGWTPLHFAAQLSHDEHAVEIAAILLKAGATIDLKDSFGNTPLFKATFSPPSPRLQAEGLG